jgi:two-component system, LuxR family, response regulator FixJ
MTAAATIFVVDDDPRVRDSLRWLLESVGLAVEAYASASGFLEAYDPERAGCLVLDIRMPGMSGLQLQDTLAARGITVPIIMVTGHGDVPTAVSAVQKGAVDFLQKPFNDQVLLDRIHSALAVDAQRRQREAECSAIRARLASLTPRELEVLKQMLAGRQNKVIGAELGISMKTVEAHRARIMEKMAVDSLASLVAICVAVGTPASRR